MVHPPTPSKRLTGKKIGERVRAHPGERGVLRPGKYGAADVDALITAQLAADAILMLALLSVSTLSFRNLFLWLCPMPLSRLKWFSNVHCKSKYWFDGEWRTCGWCMPDGLRLVFGSLTFLTFQYIVVVASHVLCIHRLVYSSIIISTVL